MPLLSTPENGIYGGESAACFPTDFHTWASEPAANADSWLTRACRRRVFNLLGDLHVGQLRLVDGDQTHHFGSDGDLSATVYVRDPKFYRRLAFDGQLGGAESYIHGEWACDDLVSLIRLLVRNEDTLSAMQQGPARLLEPLRVLCHRLRPNSTAGSRRNIAAHYDLGDDFFAHFLDSTLTYSCGLFANDETTLEAAAAAKYDYVCRSLDLSPSDHVLEIGTGWGGFAMHAARHFGCRVTTTTISQRQHDYARTAIKAADLQDRVDLRREDYRDLTGRFDKLVSIEMIEAVGHRFLPRFFGKCSQLLKDDGVMLLHAITLPDPLYDAYRRSVDFIQKYIFPGGCLLSASAMTAANAAAGDLRLLHQEDFSHDYASTLAAWRQRFHANLGAIAELNHDNRFLRAWDYYFAYCQGAFAERRIGLSHMVWTKPQSCHVLRRDNRE